MAALGKVGVKILLFDRLTRCPQDARLLQMKKKVPVFQMGPGLGVPTLRWCGKAEVIVSGRVGAFGPHGGLRLQRATRQEEMVPQWQMSRTSHGWTVPKEERLISFMSNV